MNRMPTTPKRPECAETWAGNERAAHLLELPGLVAWAHSVPAGPGDAGGDVPYVSVCPSCIVFRIALADESGHGQAVVAQGAKLRKLMQRYLSALEQAGLMRDLNQAVPDELDEVHYATMVAVGWHGRRGLLVLTNAGPPRRFDIVPNATKGVGSIRGARANGSGRPASRSGCWPISITTGSWSNRRHATSLCSTRTASLKPPTRQVMNSDVTD